MIKGSITPALKRCKQHPCNALLHYNKSVINIQSFWNGPQTTITPFTKEKAPLPKMLDSPTRTADLFFDKTLVVDGLRPFKKKAARCGPPMFRCLCCY
jgi:hypothetical protein